jgi:hypothetical protein
VIKIGMALLQSKNFDSIFRDAVESLNGPALPPDAEEARIALWRRDEWHNWFRWRVCRKGFDWSKPVWIGLLVIGFAALIIYGLTSGKLFITAGGVVLWFTIVNLGFFTYFGLILPGPPKPVPGPYESGLKLRATIGIYPPGYETRKLARIWVRIKNSTGEFWRIELVFAQLPEDLAQLMSKQQMWRMQRGDAPATQAIIETLSVSRAEIDAGVHPLKVIAWRWDEQSLEPFNRKL